MYGAPIRIAFFDDRIEIKNLGTLVPGMSVDSMKRSISKLRNRVLIRIFHELNLIEQWGSSAVSRIFREAEIAKLLGHTSVSGALHRQIRKSVDQDIIEMTLPDKPNSRLQKYRISAQGHSLITELLRT